MNRDVEVNVTGIHARDGEPTEKVETSVPGVFLQMEDGSLIIEYDESQETGSGTMKAHSKVMINPDGRSMEVVRSGFSNSRFSFGDELVYDTEYLTPYGAMMMKVRTNSFDFTRARSDDEIRVVAEYDLEIEDRVISSSMIVIDIKNAVAN